MVISDRLMSHMGASLSDPEEVRQALCKEVAALPPTNDKDKVHLTPEMEMQALKDCVPYDALATDSEVHARIIELTSNEKDSGKLRVGEQEIWHSTTDDFEPGFSVVFKKNVFLKGVLLKNHSNIDDLDVVVFTSSRTVTRSAKLPELLVDFSTDLPAVNKIGIVMSKNDDQPNAAASTKVEVIICMPPTVHVKHVVKEVEITSFQSVVNNIEDAKWGSATCTDYYNLMQSPSLITNEEIIVSSNEEHRHRLRKRVSTHGIWLSDDDDPTPTINLQFPAAFELGELRLSGTKNVNGMMVWLNMPGRFQPVPFDAHTNRFISSVSC